MPPKRISLLPNTTRYVHNRIRLIAIPEQQFRYLVRIKPRRNLFRKVQPIPSEGKDRVLNNHPGNPVIAVRETPPHMRVMREDRIRTIAPNHLDKPATKSKRVFQSTIGKSQPSYFPYAKHLRRSLLLNSPGPRHCLPRHVWVTTPGIAIRTHDKSHFAPGGDPSRQRTACMQLRVVRMRAHRHGTRRHIDQLLKLRHILNGSHQIRYVC